MEKVTDEEYIPMQWADNEYVPAGICSISKVAIMCCFMPLISPVLSTPWHPASVPLRDMHIEKEDRVMDGSGTLWMPMATVRVETRIESAEFVGVRMVIEGCWGREEGRGGRGRGVMVPVGEVSIVFRVDG